MKKLFLLTVLLLCITGIYSQVKQDQKVILVACKSGDLYIDGTLIGAIEAEDAKSHILSTGDHYVQIKSANDKINQTIKIDTNHTAVIKIGCNSEASVAVAGEQRQLLVEKQLSLSGALSEEVERTAFSLQEGDELIIDAEIANKKGTFSISIRNYERGNEIFKREQFTTIKEQTVRIPSKGIYIVNVSSNALFDKKLLLKINRVSSATGDPNFKTGVRTVYDTTSMEVLNTVSRAYSKTNSRSNRTCVTINLPENTTYWVYWIGVGQEARERMQSFASTLSSSAKFLSANPLVLFGMSMIKELPILNSTSTVSYRFMDNQNSKLFEAGSPYRYYNFKSANNVSADYSIVRNAPKELVFSMWNESNFQGQDVEIKVVAFNIMAKLKMEE